MARKEYTEGTAIDFIRRNSKTEISEKDKLITIKETTTKAVCGAIDFLRNHRHYQLNAN